jgi:hypothetical protein
MQEAAPAIVERDLAPAGHDRGSARGDEDEECGAHSEPVIYLEFGVRIEECSTKFGVLGERGGKWKEIEEQVVELKM